MEKIKLAAIQRSSDGVVFTGRNHAEIIQTRLKGELTTSVQGFITDANRFVGRSEAAEIALAAGQIDKPTNQLFSEDITGDWPWAKDVIKQLQATNKKLGKALTIADKERQDAWRQIGAAIEILKGK